MLDGAASATSAKTSQKFKCQRSALSELNRSTMLYDDIIAVAKVSWLIVRSCFNYIFLAKVTTTL